MDSPMKRHRLIAFAFNVAALVVSTAIAHAASSSNPLKAIAGEYACEFNSDSGYTAPGTNSSVPLSGVFVLGIDDSGALTPHSTTMSFGNDTDGTVCTYGSGTGSIQNPPLQGSLGDASLSFTPDNGNSPSCPSGDGTMSFGAANDALQLTYTNASGFVAHGDCEMAGAPNADAFECSYTVNGGSLGNGSGTGRVSFSSKLSQAKGKLLGVSVNATEVYENPKTLCSYFGLLGPGGFDGFKGTWSVPAAALPSCPEGRTPFATLVGFTAGPKTIKITQARISNASCSPVTTALVNTNAGIEVSPSPLKFGSSSSQNLTIKSTGKDPLNLSLLVLKGPFDFDEDHSTCSVTDPVAPGTSCVVVLTTKANKGQGQLKIGNDAAKSGETIVKLSKP